ncbi:MAG: PSD1 domain-containing protein [Verrucomicrobiae bacterium]|nr:PSD1 domain-containing protein [Verrucomicrobiae bacterium]
MVLAACAGAAAAAFAGAPERPDFERDVQSILSDNCYACHGPDDKARKAKLRLDVKAVALKPLYDDVHAILPAHPDQSLVVERIETADEDDLMPPPKTGKTLTADQKLIIRRWIEQGADWPEHWAFNKPGRPELPVLGEDAGVRNPIDRFVRAQLEHEQLSPAPEASPAALIRRASLDLTGLPPTVEEVDAYLADGSEQAYDKLVDRLLESPRYGEHQARYWLDNARYADSHGFHIDARRDIWAYREWVIEAFNENKPFDQFTVEQLAGDLLPNPTTEQRIATGYLRCNMSTGEGGAIEEEYRAKYGFDRTETTATTWLGLTMLCARCHTHKYDPIPQREYYGLFAFFDNLDGPIMDGNRPNPDPYIRIPSEEQTRRLDWLKTHIDEGRKQVDGADPGLDAAQVGWAQDWHNRLQDGWRNLPIGVVRSTVETGASLWVQSDHSITVTGGNPAKDTFELLLRPETGRLAGVRLDALSDPGLPHGGRTRAEDGRFALSEIEAELVLPPAGNDAAPEPRKLKFTRALANAAVKDGEVGRAMDGKPETAWSVAGDADAPPTALFLLDPPLDIADGVTLRVRLRFEADEAHRALARFRVSAAQGPELLANLGGLEFDDWQVIGPFATDGLEEGFARVYPPEEKLDFEASYDGVREAVRWQKRGDLRNGGTQTLVDELHGVHGAYFLHRRIQAAQPTVLDLSLRADDLYKVWLNGHLIAEQATVRDPAGVAGRFRVSLEPGENSLLVKVVNHQGAKRFAFDAQLGGQDRLSPEVAAMLSVSAQAAGEWQAPVRGWYRRQHSDVFRALFDDLAAWGEERQAIDAAIPTTLVAKERAERRETHFLSRGEYDKPGEVVSPGVLSVLNPFPPGAPTNRLGLAEWIVSPENPLTARVIVNRFWQQFFGVGLVKTAEDFGVQGERPSNPELLDWLATEFVESGWDIKHLHRLIVTSATYRQSSRVTPALFERDPENRLLARGPRFRADAEVLRDSALYVGGLLVERIGGPSVKPYEPPGLWEAVSYNNAQKYVPDRDAGQYRRSLYTYWKRQSPPPNMLLLDAPTREYCVARRPRTNTPLQSLALLNDPQFVEAARGFAARILTEAGADASLRLTWAFRQATGRQPTDAELAVLLRTLRGQLLDFQAVPDRARELLGVGMSRPSASLDPAELAAWTTVAGMILNLDETLTKG